MLHDWCSHSSCVIPEITELLKWLEGFKPSCPSAHISACAYCWYRIMGGLADFSISSTANVRQVLLPVLPLWMVQWKCLGRERPAVQDMPKNGLPKVLTAPKRPITIQASFNHKRCHQQEEESVHCHSNRHLQNKANHNHYFKYRPELRNPLILFKFTLFAVNEDWD